MFSGTRTFEARAARARAAVCVAAVLTAAACSAGDVTGRVDSGAERVCSVSLAGDELLALIVPADRVVCVSSLVDRAEVSNAAGHYPPRIPRLDARVEQVLSADPDLVLAAPWNDRGFLDLLTRSNVETFVLEDVVDFDGIREQIVALGRRLGEEVRAEAVAGALDRRLARLDRAVSSATGRPRVLSFSHSVVAGASTTVDAMIRRAGGRNAAADLGVTGHKKITVEQIIALDPDLLLLGYDPGEDVEAVLDAYPHLRATRAVRDGRVVVLPPRLLTTVTPHLVEGALLLARELHPGVVMTTGEESGRDA